MAGTLPTTPGPSDARLIPQQPVINDVSESGKHQNRINAGHLWGIKIEYPQMLRREVAPLFAFAISQRGDSFQLSLPQFNTPRGVATGTPRVVGVHSVGNSSLAIDGWSLSVTGILKAGDILKAANHSKVYMVTADADSDGTGAATISIDPPLIAALADNEAITVNNVPFTVFIDGDVKEWRTTSPQFSRYSLDLLEAL